MNTSRSMWWFFVAGLLLAVHANAAAEYMVTDLGTLGGNCAEANGLNNRGQVVGWSLDADGRHQAFVWQNGRMTGLGFLPGGTSSVAMAINNGGEITGYAHISASNWRAFLYVSNSMINIGTWGSINSMGRAINDQGAISGTAPPTNNSSYNSSFYWQTNQYTQIPAFAPGNSCDAYGINNLGQVCGITFVYSPNPRWWAYVWHDDNTNGLHDNGEMKLLGTLGVKDSVGEVSTANAINDHGLVVGWSAISNGNYPRHAFLITPSNGIWKLPSYSNTDPTNLLMRSLGTLGGPTNNSSANALNNHCWIVGTSDTPAGTNQAFLWRNETMLNLNSLIPPDTGWVLTNATAINDANEIAGSGLFNGEPRAFLLRREGRIHEFDSHVLHWSGIWSTNINETNVFTVEYSATLQPDSWQLAPPTSQWPIVDRFWSDDILPPASTRFFRVQARPFPGE